jgi:hypothetical protein
MENLIDVAKLFSGGMFDQVANQLSENVEFHIYEENMRLIGKAQVQKFCKGISKYFQTVETDFRETGSLATSDRVVIYGYAEFRKEGILLSSVNSCDVYEFDSEGNIAKIRSYCNSKSKS